MSKAKNQKPDVLIIGAGPAGVAYAGVLAKAGLQVLMIDAGPQFSGRPGRCVKNTFAYQRDLNQFTYMIQGFLHPLSVPPRRESNLGYEIDPIAWRPPGSPYEAWRYSERNAINPCQDPDKNLTGEAVAFGVGGMMQHWTAATPRHHPTMERYKFENLKQGENNDDVWANLYQRAEGILLTNQETFEHSFRNTLVRTALREYYEQNDRFEVPADPHYKVQNLPMAVTRSPVGSKNREFTIYTGTDTMLDKLIGNADQLPANLEIVPENRVKQLKLNAPNNDRVVGVTVEDLMEGDTYDVEADVYVVASGAVMSAYILWNSGIADRLPVGKYIFEHPIAFTQIVLRQDLIDRIPTICPDFKDRMEVQKQRTAAAKQRTQAKTADPRTKCEAPPPADPDLLPIPMDDPPPNIWIPVSEKRPWHCQIHKDAFSYGALPPGIDDRLIVDLRWFCLLEPPRETNQVVFEPNRFTAFGTHQPTFHFTLDDEERKRMHAMMEDMVGAAGALGAFLPGLEPRFMGKGLALHIQGTTRMGPAGDPDSVVDEYLKVQGVENLYTASNGVLRKENAANPTLTSIALALRSADQIVGELKPPSSTQP